LVRLFYFVIPGLLPARQAKVGIQNTKLPCALWQRTNIMWFVVRIFVQGMEYLFAVFFGRKGIVLSFVLTQEERTK
jgi:hypothetical protein